MTLQGPQGGGNRLAVKSLQKLNFNDFVVMEASDKLPYPCREQHLRLEAQRRGLELSLRGPQRGGIRLVAPRCWWTPGVPRPPALPPPAARASLEHTVKAWVHVGMDANTQVPSSAAEAADAK